jgi:hypothetical protein
MQHIIDPSIAARVHRGAEHDHLSRPRPAIAARLLALMLLASLAGCGGVPASPDSPRSSDAPAAERSAGALASAPATEVAAASDCEALEDCRRDCDAGAANACTRAGDALFSDDEREARRLWRRACDGDDGHGCARLAQLAADDPRAADALSERACGLDHLKSCDLLGNVRVARAMARAAGRRDAAPLFSSAAEAFGRSCDLGSWRGCAYAVHAERASGLDESEAQRARAQRALFLADESCRSGAYPACEYLAEWAERAGDEDTARMWHGRACGALLESAGTETREWAAEHPACRGSKELGIAPISVENPDEERAPATVRPEALQAQRIAGQHRIPPSTGVRLALKKAQLSRLQASIVVCISRLGLIDDVWVIEGSRAPQWDLTLVETARTWRYRPMLVDEQPVPVCTTVTFIYNQR